MSVFAAEYIALIVAGVKLLYGLYRRADENVLADALSRKIPVPPVARVPTWEETEAFVLANPEFLDVADRRTCWDGRDDVRNKVRLMVDLARDLRAQRMDEIFLFAPEVRLQQSAIVPVIVSLASLIKEVLEDDSLTRAEKTERLTRILEEAVDAK